MRKLLSSVLALSLTLGLAAPALAVDASEYNTMSVTQVIAPQYEDARAFSEGLSAVKKNGKWGYINKDNQVVIDFRYDEAWSFHEGHAIVANLLTTGEDEYSGRELYYYEFLAVDSQGQETRFLLDGYTSQWSDSDPFVWESDSETITYTAEQQANMTLASAWYSLNSNYQFHNGYFPLSVYQIWVDGEPVGQPNQYYVFDTDGSMVYGRLEQEEWSDTMPYRYAPTEGLLAFQEAYSVGGLGYYNTESGKYIHIEEFDFGQTDSFSYPTALRPFNQGLAPVRMQSYDFDNDIQISYWGMVNTAGKWVIEPAYSNFMVQDLQGTYQIFGDTGLAMVCDSNGTWGAIDKQGNTVIPFEYEALRSFVCGLAPFQQNGQYGYLNTDGSVAIPAQYAATSGFSKTLGVAVATDGQTGWLIDRYGNKIPGSETVDTSSYITFRENDIPATYTPDEYIVVEENGLYGHSRINYKPALPQQNETSSWSHALVVDAIDKDIVPVSLQNLYQQKITRAEFCALAVDLYETVTGTEIQARASFLDTADVNIQKMAGLNVISGVGNNRFDPYGILNREQAAAILVTLARALGCELDEAQAAFGDINTASSWAVSAIGKVQNAGIMSGTGDNTFSPKATYTREQSMITMLRLYEYLTK